MTPRIFLDVAVVAAALLVATTARANPPADDFLNPQPGGRHLTLFPFVGPGFRATYDERIEIERDMSELRLQVMGTVAVPFAEVSANVDVRFFLMTLGGTVGYHDEWRVLAFEPDPQTGRDRAGAIRYTYPPGVAAPLTPAQDPNIGYTDLTRDDRALKDQNADTTAKKWAFYEGRWGFVWPGYGFIGVSTFALRHEGRPDVSYDWENATVLNGGWNARWEGYFLLRERNLGFIGPAVRALYVPRNRTAAPYVTPSGVLLPQDSACQPGVLAELPCDVKRELELQYGILAGLRPNWVTSNDTFIVRVYTTYGFHDQLFGTHVFRQPIQLLFGYFVDFDL